MSGIGQKEIRGETKEKTKEKLTGVIVMGAANGSTFKKIKK